VVVKVLLDPSFQIISVSQQLFGKGSSYQK